MAFNGFSDLTYITQTTFLFLLFLQFYIYFIGAGKKIKEIILENNLDKKIYQDVLDIKSELFPPLTMNILIVGTAFVLGGGVQTKVLSKYWHYFIFYLGLLHYIKVIVLQHRSLVKNSKILSEIGLQLDKLKK